MSKEPLNVQQKRLKKEEIKGINNSPENPKNRHIIRGNIIVLVQLVKAYFSTKLSSAYQ